MDKTEDIIRGRRISLAPVTALLAQGDMLGAVAYVQRESGCSLRDAKEYVDAMRASAEPEPRLREPPEDAPSVIYGHDATGYYKIISGVRSPVFEWELPPEMRARLAFPNPAQVPPAPKAESARSRIAKKVLLTLALLLCSGALMLLFGTLSLPLRGSRGFSVFAILIALPAVSAVFLWLPLDRLSRRPDGIKKGLLLCGVTFLAVLAVMGAFLLCCLVMARFVWHTI